MILASWGPPGSPLGALLGFLGPSWGLLGRLGAVLGPSRGHYGSLRSSWGPLGPSWGSLGPSWGHLEASEAHRKRNGEKAKIINFPQVFEGFWALGGVLRGLRELLEPSCDPLGASWRHVGSCLEPSSAVLSHLGGYLGASEALLEPSWAILDALTPRGPPRPGPGEGVGGGVNPSPKGKKEVGRGNSLDHLRPEGWWDSEGSGRDP